MEKMDRPANPVGLTLLHKCNFNCTHCGYLYVGDSEEFFKKAPPPNKKGEGAFRAGTLIGEYYRIENEKVAKLGYLNELFSDDEING